MSGFLFLKKLHRSLEADERSLQLLNELGLKDKSNRPAYKLSGGEQQRLLSPGLWQILRDTCSLMNLLVIWMLKNSESVFELLLEMAEKLKLAVILVTHNEKLS